MADDGKFFSTKIECAKTKAQIKIEQIAPGAPIDIAIGSRRALMGEDAVAMLAAMLAMMVNGEKYHRMLVELMKAPQGVYLAARSEKHMLESQDAKEPVTP